MNASPNTNLKLYLLSYLNYIFISNTLYIYTVSQKVNLSNLNHFQNFEHRLRFDKVTESLKVETFLRHLVYFYILDTDNHSTYMIQELSDED